MGSLAADKRFKEMEAASGTIARTQPDLEKARVRMALGNPPGKPGSRRRLKALLSVLPVLQPEEAARE